MSFTDTRRKKCKVRFSLIDKNKVFQKNYTEVEVKKLVVTSGYGTSKNVERACCGRWLV